MVRRDLLIWGLLAVAVALGTFVQKTRRLFVPGAVTFQSEAAPPMDSFAVEDFPAEWRPADKGWDLFTPPAAEPAKSYAEVVEESIETPPSLSVEGHITVTDGLAYVILRNAATGQSYRLSRQEPIPDTDLTIADFHLNGDQLAVEVLDGDGQCFTISTDDGPDSPALSWKNTH